MGSDSVLSSGMEALAFELGGQTYAIDIHEVRELRVHEKLTALAGAPASIRGVINLRGVIVPVIDMRIRLRLDMPDGCKSAVTIILHVRDRIVGVMVDHVRDVVRLGAGDIKPMPDMGAAIDATCLVGMGIVDGQMITLLDIEKFLSSEDIDLLQKAAA